MQSRILWSLPARTTSARRIMWRWKLIKRPVISCVMPKKRLWRKWRMMCCRSHWTMHGRFPIRLSWVTCFMWRSSLKSSDVSQRRMPRTWSCRKFARKREASFTTSIMKRKRMWWRGSYSVISAGIFPLISVRRMLFWMKVSRLRVRISGRRSELRYIFWRWRIHLKDREYL